MNDYQSNSNDIYEKTIESEILYVVLVYYDFNKTGRRKKLLLEFLDRYGNTEGTRFVVVEASDSEFDLPLKSYDIFIHHKFKIKHYFQLYQNLINIAISKLPKDWQYVSWVDSDITFLNKNWVRDTIMELKKSHMVQLFQTAIFMGPDGEALNIFKGVGYLYQQNSHDLAKICRNCWPGYAWAMTKTVFHKMNGLFEIDIIAGGDSIIAFSFAQNTDIFLSNFLFNSGEAMKEYIKQARIYQLKVKINKFVLSFINGTVLHNWHGPLSERKYIERYDVIKKHGFNPQIDLIRDKDGLISLSEIGERLHNDLKKIFCPKCFRQ